MCVQPVPKLGEDLWRVHELAARPAADLLACERFMYGTVASSETAETADKSAIDVRRRGHINLVGELYAPRIRCGSEVCTPVSRSS